VSRELGVISVENFERQKKLLQKVGLPIKLQKTINKKAISDLMQKDKICIDCGLTIVMLERIGKFKVSKNIAPKIIESVLSSL